MCTASPCGASCMVPLRAMSFNRREFAGLNCVSANEGLATGRRDEPDQRNGTAAFLAIVAPIGVRAMMMLVLDLKERRGHEFPRQNAFDLIPTAPNGKMSTSFVRRDDFS
jgi:hypothetical protein